jgi:propionyl-CoA synthetase
MRKIADEQDYTVPSTIDDPLILDEIRTAISRRREGRGSIPPS